MVNQQKVVQQETAYSAVTVVVNDHIMYPHPCLYRFYNYMTPFRSKRYRDGDTYDQLHYRQYLVALLFADLPSLSLFIS